jgi:hypothetical protein
MNFNLLIFVHLVHPKKIYYIYLFINHVYFMFSNSYKKNGAYYSVVKL